MNNYFIEALHSLAPGAQWSLIGDDYENIEWINGNGYEKPTKQQVLEEAKRIEEEKPFKEIKKQRAESYSQEADPIAFKMLRGEATKEEWEAKIEEIRQRYPYSS